MMIDRSHTAYEPHPTAAMDRQYRGPGMNLLKHDNIHTDLQGKRRIRYLEDEYAKLWQMYGDIEDERDRLREALEMIATYTPSDGQCDNGHTPVFVAHTALQEDRDD